MKLHYIVQGRDADDSPFELNGEIEGDSPIDPEAHARAGMASFHQLTRGLAERAAKHGS